MKIFELFCIKNDFAKYFAKCHNLFKYFVLHIMVIPQNDTFLYYRTNQISFSGTRVNQIVNKCLNG